MCTLFADEDIGLFLRTSFQSNSLTNVLRCVRLCRMLLLFDASPRAGLGSCAALGVAGVASVAFGLISRSNLSRHFVVCCDETPKHAEQPGVSPCCWTRDFVMYLLLLLAIGVLLDSRAHL